MASEQDTPKSPIDELEQRLAARLFKYFLASLMVIIGATFALGSWVAKSEAKTDSNTEDIVSLRATVQGDAVFKQNVTNKLATLEERSSNATKAIDRMDNKLDRVIRVYDVPK